VRRWLIWLPLAVCAGIAWLVWGRQFTLLLDSVATIGHAPLPVSPLRYDGGGFVIGRQSMTFGALDNLPFHLDLECDPANRVILASGGREFTMGPRTNLIDPKGRPDIDLVPESGDELTFVTSRSALPWPTPFEVHFMSRSPWWKRYVYYRLSWRKPSGAQMDMLWRYEQDYYGVTGYGPPGWDEPVMRWNSQTGLIAVSISESRGSADSKRDTDSKRCACSTTASE
jgi:hypothetical protein